MSAIDELDEGEASGTAGFTVDRQHDLGRGRNRPEIRAQISFGGAVGKITDEQTDGQSTLSYVGWKKRQERGWGRTHAGSRFSVAKTLPELTSSCKQEIGRGKRKAGRLKGGKVGRWEGARLERPQGWKGRKAERRKVGAAPSRLRLDPSDPPFKPSAFRPSPFPPFSLPAFSPFSLVQLLIFEYYDIVTTWLRLMTSS